MVAVKNNRDIAFNKVVQRTVILGIIIGIVIGGAILFTLPSSQSEILTVQVDPGNDIMREQIFDYSSYTGSTHTRICQVTDFSTTPIIWFNGYGDEIHVDHQDTGGFKVSGTNYGVSIQMRFHILIDVYENATFTIGLSEVQGPATIRTIMGFVRSTTSYSETVNVEDGDNSDVIVHESLVPLRENSDSWILETRFTLEIRQEQTGSITVDSLSIDIDSLELVYPFQVQFYDQSGTNIYEDGGSYQGNINPLLNITDDSLNHSVIDRESLITGRANNGIVFLPEGNYTFGYGWGPYWSPQIVDSFSVVLQPGMAFRTDIYLMTSRLFIDMNQKLGVYVNIRGDIYTSEWEVHIYDELLPPNFFIYVPADCGEIEVTIQPTIMRTRRDPSIIVNVEGTNDYTVQANFPIFTFLFFGFDSAQLLLIIIIIGAIIASMISLQRLFDKQPVRNIISHQEFIPFILALIGYLTPWFVWNSMRFDGGVGSSQFEYLIITTGLAIKGGTDRLVTFIPIEYLSSVTSVQWIYWFPIAIIFLRLTNLLNTESKLGFYSPYIVMVIFGVMTLNGLSLYEVSIGPFFLMASLLVMILLKSSYGEQWLKKLKRDGE
ncbi:MAG: hypothetical protein RTU63_08780 [Candidatus Thorarchaeota archaeon]